LSPTKEEIGVSMMNDLQALERRVRQRLTELRPLVDEFRELEHIAQRLGISTNAPRKAAAASASKGQTRSTSARGRTRGKAAARRSTARKRAAAPKATTEASPAVGTAAPVESRQSPAQPKARSTRTRKTSTTRPARRASARNGGARPSTRRDQLLALVKQRPGITVAQAGQEMGVDATSLYRIVRRLEDDGAIKKQGRELQPV
jgi:hypothetical protein